MSSNPSQLSPRHEALDAVKNVRSSLREAPIISELSWEKIIGIAWEHRSQLGDRREIQRELREVLLDASRDAVVSDAAE
jgi:hypothetical protein